MTYNFVNLHFSTKIEKSKKEKLTKNTFVFYFNQSTFTPINVFEEELIHDAEVHTRELQVEEGLQLYKKALKYQKEGDRVNAHKEYDVLFNLEVLNLSSVCVCLFISFH